jgi:tRNA (mo5U34)-methyltransferase
VFQFRFDSCREIGLCCVTLFDREAIFSRLTQLGAGEWVSQLRQCCAQAFHPDHHGTLDRWIQAWHRLPQAHQADFDAGGATVTLRGNLSGPQQDLPHASTIPEIHATLKSALMEFHPWRKGPFELFGIPIDTEWRSDWKWDRIAPHVNLRGSRVLDVGSGNGYYGWRMAASGAELVCGLDPFLLYVMQYEVVRRYVTDFPGHAVLPAGDEVLNERLRLFDVVFSMGVLYHQSGPIEHLQRLAGTLRSGGQLILETLILDSDIPTVLVPENRYAKMRNVWFIPSIAMLLRWLRRTGFRNCEVLDVTPTTTAEQRRTEWMTFESLSDFLDPSGSGSTIEGEPGPIRAIITATAS